MFRRKNIGVEVLLVHPGGPIWAKRDLGAWSIPKGEAMPEEDLLAAAKREFKEELGVTLDGTFLSLGFVTQKSGKIVHAWAVEGDLNTTEIKSNTFEMEWPPHSGEKRQFPEVDRALFFAIDEAQKKINPAQIELLERLQKHLHDSVV